MKKIIDGKLYNTDTATRLADWDNGYGGGDLDYCEETLYRTKKGAYFLYGCGGARSSYSRYYGDGNSSSGEDISVFTEEEAKEWALEHASADTYEEIFGLVPEA